MIEADRIKRRRHEFDAERGGICGQLAKGFQRQLKIRQHVLLGTRGSGVGFLVVGHGCRCRDNGLQREGLKLDGIRASCGCGFHQTARHGEVAIVIDPGFGNDEDPARFRTILHISSQHRRARCALADQDCGDTAP